MKQIAEYHLTPAMRGIHMHKGAEVLSVGQSNGALCIWAKEENNEALEWRDIFVLGTGEEATDADDSTYLGTVVFRDGHFVAHVFENEANARPANNSKDLAL